MKPPAKKWFPKLSVKYRQARDELALVTSQGTKYSADRFVLYHVRRLALVEKGENENLSRFAYQLYYLSYILVLELI